MKKSMFVVICAFCGALLLAGTVQAGLLVYEPFDYSTGSAIIGQTNTYSPGNPVWNQTVTGSPGSSVHQAASGSLSGPSGYPTNIGNSGSMLNGDNAEIARMNLPQQYGAGTTLYYSLLLNVPDVAGLTVPNTNLNANNDVLLAFNNSTGTGVRPTLWAGELIIRLGSVANTYNLGIRASTTAASSTYFSGNLAPGTTYFVVGRYASGATAGTGGVNDLWINPNISTFGVSEANVPSPNGTTLGHISNTASNDHVDSLIIGAGVAAGATPNQTLLDEIRVGTEWANVTVPEPGTCMLLLSSCFFLGFAARRRSA